MNLVANWRAIVSRSWSFWIAIVSAGLSAAELGFGLFREVLDIKYFAVATMALGVAAAVARVIHQASISGEQE